jgi:hypothetical protein
MSAGRTRPDASNPAVPTRFKMLQAIAVAKVKAAVEKLAQERR